MSPERPPPPARSGVSEGSASSAPKKTSTCPAPPVLVTSAMAIGPFRPAMDMPSRSMSSPPMFAKVTFEIDGEKVDFAGKAEAIEILEIAAASAD